MVENTLKYLTSLLNITHLVGYKYKMALFLSSLLLSHDESFLYIA